MDEEKKAALFLLFGNQISHKPLFPPRCELAQGKAHSTQVRSAVVNQSAHSGEISIMVYASFYSKTYTQNNPKNI
jgi:hypothetical protein